MCSPLIPRHPSCAPIFSISFGWTNIIRHVFFLQSPSAEDIVCDNPEQLHTGFFSSVELGFEDVTMALKQKKGKADRMILDGSLCGKCRPGRMLAIMGPSGR